MSSQHRRAGAQGLKVLASSVDPAAVAGQVQVYAKTVSGSAQLFARESNGSISRLTETPTADDILALMTSLP